MGYCASGCLAFSLALFVPFDVVPALWERFPVVSAVGVAGDGRELPRAVGFDLFEDVDASHFRLLFWTP